MDELVKVVLAAIGASGIIGTILTIVITRQINAEFAKHDQREKLRDENQLLMMDRVDNSAEMTHLMAKKLHDAGVINGDLEELDEKNKRLNEKYNDHMKKLATEVLRR